MVGGVTIDKTFALNKALPNSIIKLEISITKHDELAEGNLAAGDSKLIPESSDEDERFDVN
jgi:hypothetical protein